MSTIIRGQLGHVKVNVIKIEYLKSVRNLLVMILELLYITISVIIMPKLIGQF